MAIILNDNDVLMGRGGRNHEHEGNEQLRRIAHSRVREYERATKKQKAAISREIMRQIHSMEPPGRFLKKCYSTYEWKVVKDAVAREKVCQALRDAVAIEREQLDSVPSLPDALEVLSSECFLEQQRESDASKVGPPLAVVTPGRNSDSGGVPREYEGAHHYQTGLSDDFDLFEGKLLDSSDDEVLKHV